MSNHMYNIPRVRVHTSVWSEVETRIDLDVYYNIIDYKYLFTINDCT